MDKNVLESLVQQRLSSYKISKIIGKSQTATRYWLKKYSLKTKGINAAFEENNKIYKICAQCKQKKEVNKDNFYVEKNGKFHPWCKICNCKRTFKRQKMLKQQCLEYKGSKCVVCGYNKYFGALEFHHLDKTKKEYAISDLKNYNFETLKKELDKCVILCSNCHAEYHGGLIDLGTPGVEPGIGKL